MAQLPVGIGETVYAAIMNNLVSYLQQPSGAQETGKYIIEENSYLSGAFVSCPINTWSRNSTPVSCSIDTADNGVVGFNALNAPSVGHITMGGAQVFASTTAINLDPRCGGNWTMQY